MTKKVNKISYHTEEQKEMIHFLIVLSVIIVLVLGFYFISKFFILDQNLFENTYIPGTVNSERIVVGTLFNRPEKEYYVIAYDEDAKDAVYYSSLSASYKGEKALKVYHLDLGNVLNKSYYIKEGESNKKATKPSEIKLKDLTLIKIKEGKIEKYLENLSDIEKELTITK